MRDESERQAAELAMRGLCDAGDHPAAAKLALSTYGSEILSFFAATMGDAEQANEAYAVIQLMLWEGLQRFRWGSTARTWMYALARHARSRVARSRLRGTTPISQVSSIATPADSTVPPHARTTNKQRLASLRDQLPADDRELLILRVDRQLGWLEIVQILGLADTDDRAAAEREATGLRKRFQRLKEALRRGLTKTGE